MMKILLQLLFTVLILSGCAGNSVPPEQIKNYALIEGGRGNALVTGSFAGSVNVLPGVYTFNTIPRCPYNDCPKLTYKFRAEAGYRYVLRVDNTIVVTDPFDPYERIVDKLVLVGDEYVTRKAKKEYDHEQLNQMVIATAEKFERRKQNLPLIRKVGTKVCRLQGQILYIGFVENVTDDKIQIRVADAVVEQNHNARLGSFSPSIIWDNPLNWDICE
jgi:hypothetical protein